MGGGRPKTLAPRGAPSSTGRQRSRTTNQFGPGLGGHFSAHSRVGPSLAPRIDGSAPGRRISSSMFGQRAGARLAARRSHMNASTGLRPGRRRASAKLSRETLPARQRSRVIWPILSKVTSLKATQLASQLVPRQRECTMGPPIGGRPTMTDANCRRVHSIGRQLAPAWLAQWQFGAHTHSRPIDWGPIWAPGSVACRRENTKRRLAMFFYWPGLTNRLA